MNKVYGFEGEVKAKYTQLTFRLFSEIFNAIPHGGLFSKDGVKMDEVRTYCFQIFYIRIFNIFFFLVSR
jgi:hypothetical protein